MMRPFFSVIITTYNRPELIKIAVESVTRQKHQDYEIVIVNDGSSKDYSSFEKTIQNQKNIAYFKKENEGRSIARNFGVAKSKGVWICFLDDDDAFLDNHLLELYKAITKDKNPCTLYHTRAIIKNQNGVTSNQPYYKNNLQGGEKLMNDQFILSSTCINAEIAKKHPYNPHLSFSEDFELWIRLSRILKFKAINKYTIEYLVHDANSVNWSYESNINKLTTLKYISQHHSGIIRPSYLRIRIAQTASIVADYDVRANRKKDAISHTWLIIRNNPKYILKRHFWGLMKGLI